jgi:uncharacterized protein (DUF849 family)
VAFIKACLNGGRSRADLSAVPESPRDVALSAAEAADAGAAAIHVHVRNADGKQSLAAPDVDETVAMLRHMVAIPVGVTTGAWIATGDTRLDLVRGWSTLPDFASVNFHEEGAAELARLLLDRGIGVEAGLWTADDATLLIESGLAEECTRLLLEPMADDLEEARALAASIEGVLDEAGTTAPRLLHGRRDTAWPLLIDAVRRGLQTRIGFEDTTVLPDGSPAASNRDLVAVALRLAANFEGEPGSEG